MKELKLNISPLYVKAEWLQDASSYNENYYKIESIGDSCCIHYPFNIIQEICQLWWRIYGSFFLDFRIWRKFYFR